MTELMERGPVPIDRLEIGRRRRHLHEIGRRVVVGARTADAEIGAGGGNQRLGSRLNLIWWRRDDRSSNLLGQTFALVDVKDGKALEKRDGARLLTGLRGAPTFVVRRKAIGIDDGRSPLTLPDMAAEPEGLAKGEPALSSEAVLYDCPPKNEHIDPGISAPRGSVARHRERRLNCRRSPWLHPGDTPGLQLGDDLVGDFGVKARAVVSGTKLGQYSRHRGSPRRAPEASPPIFTRRGRPGLHSHSQRRVTGKRTAHSRDCLFDRMDAPKG
jgi:hypothetical protein